MFEGVWGHKNNMRGSYTIGMAVGGGDNIICDLIAASSTFDDSNSITTQNSITTH